MFKSEEKTGYSQAAVGAFITSGLLGILPSFGIDMTTQQATNAGLFVAGVGWGIRQAYKKWRKSK